MIVQRNHVAATQSSTPVSDKADAASCARSGTGDRYVGSVGNTLKFWGTALLALTAAGGAAALQTPVHGRKLSGWSAQPSSAPASAPVAHHGHHHHHGHYGHHGHHHGHHVTAPAPAPFDSAPHWLAPAKAPQGEAAPKNRG